MSDSPTSEPNSVRPSLRLIAGEVVSSLAHDFEAVADAALGTPRAIVLQPARASEGLDEPAAKRTRIVVVGAGIAGLAAAWSLANDRRVDADIVVYEASGTVGGKLRLGEIEGLPVDIGAEAMLAVRPEALALTRAAGLGSSIVNPATTQAGLWARGAIRPLPAGLISGIPTDLRALAASETLSLPGLLRIPLDYLLPKTTIVSDISVGDYVATRLGREVVDGLVEPMLGGVYAGRAEDLSLEMTVPALFRLAKRERSLLEAAKEARATGAAPAGARRGPVFAGIKGGVGRLPVAMAEKLELRGVVIESDSSVSGLRRTKTGWRLAVVKGGKSHRVDADAVVLAVPAPAAAKLLRQANPDAAATLDTVNYASVAVTTFLYEPTAVPATMTGSGFLVPPAAGLAIKAATYSSRKWAWMARAGAAGQGQRFVAVRASVGRFGEPSVLQRDDNELAELMASELSLVVGLPEKPIASLVTRWDSGLPQYTVGHRGRIARVRELLVDTPGVTVCGAAFDGVGIAACIGSAQFAAGQLDAYLSEREQWAHGRP